MNYNTFNEKLGNRKSKKLANNTYAIRLEDGSIAIRLHQTNVVTYFQNGKIVLSSGNWKTVTTKARINEFSPFSISQNKGIWNISKKSDWVYNPQTGVQNYPKSVIFQDGITYFRGRFGGYAKDDKKENQLRKNIRAYGKLVAESLPLPAPSNGDCWYCSMRTEEGKPLGECNHDTGHLRSHLEEKYVVPSLVYRALESAGCNPQGGGSFWFSAAFGNVPPQGFAKAKVGKFVNKYLYKQFGLVV